jgi:molecular chaperone Hsp33
MDTLVRAISDDLAVRVLAADITETVREACRRQDARGVEAEVLARIATASALLATLTKRADERVILQVRGGGQLGSVVADAYTDGRVRACLEHRLKPGAYAGKLRDRHGRLSTMEAIGKRGFLMVTRDLGLDQRYQGSVSVEHGEIDLDVQDYLEQSEQIPSALTCAAQLDAFGNVTRAAGILCQTFPGGDRARIDEIRERFANGALATLLAHPRTPEELVSFALAGARHDVMERSELRFHCPCGAENALRVLATLGADDLDALAAEQPHTDVSCHFCGSVYSVPAEEVRALAERMREERS